MPRNSSGVYSLPQSPFVPGTTIESADVNSDLSDIATALTGSLPVNGSAPMTAPLLHSDGSQSAPSITFESAPGTGFYLSGTNEITWVSNGSPGASFNADLSVDFLGGITITGAATLNGRDIDALDGGTVALFRQTAAPTGWTKITTNVDNRALRVTSGTVSQGGTHDFSDVFGGSWFSDQFTLTVAEIPLHAHPFRLEGAGESSSDATGGMLIGNGQPRTNYSAFTGTPSDTAGEQIGGTGGGGGHDHNLDLAVLYLDLIVASKD